MIAGGSIVARRVVLPPAAAATRTPTWRSRKESRHIAVTNQPQDGRGALLLCHSGPQHWRSVPTKHPTGSRPQADGPPPLLWVAGMAMMALVAFNILRGLVLAWVRSQSPRSLRYPAKQRQQQQTSQEAGEQSSAGEAGSALLPGRGSSATREATAAGPGVAAAAAVVPAGTAATESSDAAKGSAAEGVEVDDAGRVATVTAATSAAAEGEVKEGSGPPVQIASYQLRPRGTKSNNNLGRVVFCASLAPPSRPRSESPGALQPASSALQTRRSLEWHQRFWQPLIDKYADGPDDRVTGLLVVYDSSVLHILEGDNNQLFALLRELRPRDVGVHRLQEIRVPCYILDLRERLFDRWHCASAQRPAGRRRTYGMSSVTGSLIGGTGARKSRLSEAGVDAEAEAVKSPEQQLVTDIQQLELFIKFVGPKLSALATKERDVALGHLQDFETTTPREAVVSSLASDQLAPDLVDFIDTFDADFQRYMSLLALASEAQEDPEEGGLRAAALAGDILHLQRYYGEHLKRDLKEAMAQLQEERDANSVEEVASRLSRGMRLRVTPWQ